MPEPAKKARPPPASKIIMPVRCSNRTGRQPALFSKKTAF